MLRILTVGLFIAVLLAACGKTAPSQPAPGARDLPVVTIFKPPT